MSFGTYSLIPLQKDPNDKYQLFPSDINGEVGEPMKYMQTDQ